MDPRSSSATPGDMKFQHLRRERPTSADLCHAGRNVGLLGQRFPSLEGVNPHDN